MDDQKKITFAKVDWDLEVESHLGLIAGLTDADFAFYRQSIEQGHKGLMGVFFGGDHVGSLIWCLSDEPKGRVFIVDEMGAVAREGLDLALATDKMARVFAPQLEAQHLRFMTVREGMVRKLKEAYDTTYILECAL